MSGIICGLPSRESSALGGPVAIDAAVGPAQWDRMLTDFHDISYEQTSPYAEQLWGRQTSRLMVWQNGSPIGGAIVAILAPPLLRRGLAYVKFGPLWRRAGMAADMTTYKLIVGALAEEYCLRQGHLLTILPRPSVDYLSSETAALEELGFRRRRPMADPNRYFVDLSLSEEEQLASLAQKWRYNLRKALANRLTLFEVSPQAGYPVFVELHRQMVDRKRFSDVDKLSILRRPQALPAEMRPRIFLASQNGAPLAGAVISVLGDIAYYLFGASAAQALSVNAGYALQWHIIGQLRGSGARWYDLGGEAQEPGLRQFKRGLAGKAGHVAAIPGEMDLWHGAAGRHVADAIYALRSARRRWRSLNGMSRAAR